jgi:hypothetical protein
MVNEVGMIADHLLGPDGRIPEYYWNLAGAVYAYLWSRLSELGIDVVGESQLVGYRPQFPGVMLDWTASQPNARCWTLKPDGRFRPGDSLVRTSVDSGTVHAGIMRRADRKVLW